MLKSLYPIFDKLKKLAGIDSHIGATIIFRLWTVISGAGLLLLMPLYLTSSEQGYYFTFSSIIGLQVFFELGFNYVLTQVVAHEMRGIKIDKNGMLAGDLRNLQRLTSLCILIRKWYMFLAITYFMIVFSLGYSFFSLNDELEPNEWLYAWAILVFSTAINLYISPFLAILEGMGFVSKIAYIRLLQSLIGYFLLILLFNLNFGLLSIPAISLTAAFFSSSWIYKKHRNTFKRNTISRENSISWRREIFPFQWKIALSWVSGYFIFQLFTPMIFTHQGAIEAGKIGVTLAIFSAILSISMSWISAKAPVLAKLVAEGKRNELNILFIMLLKKSGFVNFCLLTSFILVISLFKTLNFKLVERISEPNILLCLLGISIINHLIYSMSIYMRCHKKEPMLSNSLCTAIISIPAVFFLSKINVVSTMLGYLSVGLFVSLPWCIVLFLKYYNIKERSFEKKY